MLLNSLVTKVSNQEGILIHRCQCQITICIIIKWDNLEETNNPVNNNLIQDNKMADQLII